ncbi:MAG: hypothetical protein A3I77_00145 [Gammaproteobacteria bacterium RIFCSPLOWO2_02_FULL_42_14]|nr:MAG: hypothetical protein A3B71_00145 [Gammaproteobacteria bacterium RIFCSPHIGHO2_02_FULL_42_43]OGT51902.1 MAG: hypothetical protein A3E54_01170 [Gammaproteobacteria bacterium RIFCSPHIGHO2_12_FULL_41_25]OGT62416.1 MAG: hypothetical protein A3I77_00145 [Gammaproteobacteria bacterium RIFCSPLOWO2_02_FULL_42_14]OGT85368.1 MAG: hypothetical protein A3G86_08095 [Gammaproteobacteria bacterium RIFCSPLOWO2_12_FULL_42_18]
MSIIYLNGQFIPQEKATVSIMDRGFLFGDGVYEVIPAFHGKLFLCDEHLHRLEKSLYALNMKNPHSLSEWKTIFKTLIEKNSPQEKQSVYCQITRGTEETRQHLWSDHLIPTVVCFLLSAKTTPMSEIEKGYSAITAEDSRRSDCFIKAIDLLPSILAMQAARKAGAYEAILIRNGIVTECIASNVFIVKNNIILTPPLSRYILKGVTRDLILQLAAKNNIPCEEKTITPDMLKNADEIWVTGSTKELSPIVLLDKKSVGLGTAGPVWKKMRELYDIYKSEASART